MPHEDSYTDTLTLLKLNELLVHFDVICLSYVHKVKSNDDHMLFGFSNEPSACTHIHFADKALFHKYC